MSREICWSCRGDKVDVWGETCEWCEGRGWRESHRDYIFARRKNYLGRGHPNATKDGNEKWERFSCEVPPEIAAELDLLRKQMSTTSAGMSRAAITRYALRTILDKHMPEEPTSIESEAEEYVAEIGEAQVVDEH